MRGRFGVRLVALLVLAAAPGGVASADLADSVAVAAGRAAHFYLGSVSIYGGYRSGYRADLSDMDDRRVDIEHSGTPVVGSAYLALYRATGDPRYLAAAKSVAHALMRFQHGSGGWSKWLIAGSKESYYRHDKDRGSPPYGRDDMSTFDDNTTQRVIDFFLELDESVGFEGPTHDGLVYAMDFMLESQFENGAWPQIYPLPNGYGRLYTFNDGAINDCIRVMLSAWHVLGDERYLQSALMGGDFIILSQLPAPQAAWAQQYEWDLTPAWAREFEPPGVCAWVTDRNIRTLVDLYLESRDERFLEPIPAAIAWFDSSRLDSATLVSAGLIGNTDRGNASVGIHARLYEVGTNVPIFGDVGQPLRYYYSYRDIRAAQAGSYQWFGSYGGGRRYYEHTISSGRAARTDAERPAKARPVREILAELDARGAWASGYTISTGGFAANVGNLANYLSSVGWRANVDSILQPTRFRTEPAAVTTSTDSVTIMVDLQGAWNARVDVSPLLLGQKPLLAQQPSGAEARVRLRDDGAGHDRVAGDGTLSVRVRIWPIEGTRYLTVTSGTTSGDWAASVFPVTVQAPSSILAEPPITPPRQTFAIAARPNPFNGETVLSFHHPGGTGVEVTVSDVLGRRVRTFETKARHPGRHHIRWDGTDRTGRPVASGVYIVRVATGTRAIRGRAVVAR